MTAYIIRRLWQMIPTMLGVILLVFILFNAVGGDPAYVLAGKISNKEQIENIRRQLGVDQPYYVQLGIFIKQVVTADFGASWSTNERAAPLHQERAGQAPAEEGLDVERLLARVQVVAACQGRLQLRARMCGRPTEQHHRLDQPHVDALVAAERSLAAVAGDLEAAARRVGTLVFGRAQRLIFVEQHEVAVERLGVLGEQRAAGDGLLARRARV